MINSDITYGKAVTLDRVYIVLAKGIGPMFFNALYDGIEACARLRGMGYEPRLQRNPNPRILKIS